MSVHSFATDFMRMTDGSDASAGDRLPDGSIVFSGTAEPYKSFPIELMQQPAQQEMMQPINMMQTPMVSLTPQEPTSVPMQSSENPYPMVQGQLPWMSPWMSMPPPMMQYPPMGFGQPFPDASSSRQPLQRGVAKIPFSMFPEFAIEELQEFDTDGDKSIDVFEILEGCRALKREKMRSRDLMKVVFRRSFHLVVSHSKSYSDRKFVMCTSLASRLFLACSCLC